MIADQKTFTAKKLLEAQFVLALIGIFVLILTGMAIVVEQSDIGNFMVLVVQAVLLFSLVLLYRKTGSEKCQEAEEVLPPENYETELADWQKKCASRNYFIETAGADLLEASRAVYDTAGFLKANSQAGSQPGKASSAVSGIESELLKNAGWVYGFSRDLVLLSQLKKGSVCLLEQGIDPVELLKFCASKTQKYFSERQVVELVESPSRPLLISGDLAKLKKTLVKLFTCVVRLLQIDGSKIQVRIFRDKTGNLIYSIKLVGRYLNNRDFDKLCCPLDNFGKNDRRIDLGLAIALRFARLHGGDIVIRKQSSDGTVLGLCLPKYRISEVGSKDNGDQKSRSTCIQVRAPECRLVDRF